MAAFPTTVNPTYDGFRKSSAPKARIVRFADGYEQRVVFGLAPHSNAKTFDFQWKLNTTQFHEIEAFLDARAEDQDSFDYQPYGEANSMKFVCEKWSHTSPVSNFFILTATFRQVFEPS